jgi:small-conductance mechanosensitive channel
MNKTKRIRHFLIEMLILAMSVLILRAVLNQLKLSSNLQQQAADFGNELTLAEQQISENETEKTENLASFDSSAAGRGNTIAWYMENHPEDLAGLDELCRRWSIKQYSLLNADGTVQASNGTLMQDHSAEMKTLAGDQQPVTIDGERYYAAALNDGRVLLYSRDFTAEQDQLDRFYSLSNALSGLNAGNTGTIFAVSTLDGSILYHAEESLIGMDAGAAGYDTAVLKDGFSGVTVLNGEKVYASCRQVKDQNLLLTAEVPYRDLTTRNRTSTDLELLFFTIVIALIIVYSGFIRRDLASHPEKPDAFVRWFGHLYVDTEVRGKIRKVILIGIAMEALLAFYGETLGTLSRQASLASSRLDAVRAILEDDSSETQEITAEFDQDYTLLGQRIAFLLKLDPALVSHDSLKHLADLLYLRSIYVFDAAGTTAAMSTDYRTFSLSRNEGDQSYQFWPVVNGYQASYIQDAGKDDLGNDVQYVGVQRLDADGMVQIGVDPSRLLSRLDTASLNRRLEAINIGQNGFLFSVKQETGMLSAYPDSGQVGRPASQIGLSAAALADGYSGFQTLGGIPYFVNGILYQNSDYIYTAVPLSVIYRNRLAVTAEVTLVSGILMLAIMAMLVCSRNPQEERLENEQEEAGRQQAPLREQTFFERLRTNGSMRTVQTVSTRYDDHIPWKDRTPEQKLGAVIGGFLLAASMTLAIGMEFFRSRLLANSILAYIMGRQWEKGLNLFSLTYCLIAMTIILVTTWLIRKMLLYLLSQFGSRSETVGHLTDSFLKYASVIGGIFYCLSAVGLNTGTLLASAGILSLVVGLGAQSLISDILAGMSIVFEGSFRVGDIVTIDGWRGEVVEIGIRTTKVRSAGNDIRIFNNAAISSVINMTKQYSYASVDVGIEYSESLEHVEAVLKQELPKIKKKIPAIIAGPYYKGVTSLGDSSVNLRILAQCNESDRIQVTRDLNRAILLLFDRNHISIPYPQIVVNSPSTGSSGSTAREKRIAEAFVSEQKELSKEIQKSEE